MLKNTKYAGYIATVYYLIRRDLRVFREDFCREVYRHSNSTIYHRSCIQLFPPGIWLKIGLRYLSF